MAKKTKGRGKPKSRSRRLAVKAAVALLILTALLGGAGEWFVHHPRAWQDERAAAWPAFLSETLIAFGCHFANLTDGLGWTGYDTVYEYDEAAPSGQVTFAGAPRRTGFPAPSDIRILDRGEFLVGWSDSLRHPVWCAYHVTKEARYPDGKRPSFLIDKSVALAPRPNDYLKCGFDRGHMVPNHAIVSRYGEEMRRRTFLMSNIAPQKAALNRGVWRDVEHRIANFWTARYGEIWVVVGAIPPSGPAKRTQADVDIPSAYYQIVLAQEGLDVRALAVLLPQNVAWTEWAARHIVSIDDLEKLTGLDFNPNMPSFIQDPLEAETPNRLWPICASNVFSFLALRYL